MLLMKAKSIFK